MAAPSHHVSASRLLELAAEKREALTALGLSSRPFALCVRNSVAHAATLKAAADLKAFVALAPNGAPPVLELAASQAGIDLVVEVDEAGVRAQVSGGGGGAGRPQDAAEPKKPRIEEEPLQQWTREAQLSGGACAVATSGSGQSGSQLVAYRWDSCNLQARVTAERTLREAAPKGGIVRFVAASSIGHAYNLNGFFAALAAGAEVCVPANASELALTLATQPLGCEATVLFSTPQMYKALLELEDARSGALCEKLSAYSSPVYAFSAGCPLPAATLAGLARSLGLRIMQNYGTSETGIISMEEICPASHPLPGTSQEAPPVEGNSDPSANKGVPWGDLELRHPGGGRLLPPRAEGEVAIHVPWSSDGYLRSGRLVPHSAAPFVATGDAGRVGPPGPSGRGTLVVMQRLRAPLELHRDGLRVLLQPYEVEEALLRCNPEATSAAALQGPNGQLFCVVACPREPRLEGCLQPDKLVRVDQLPTSPAGKILHSVLFKQLLSD